MSPQRLGSSHDPLRAEKQRAASACRGLAAAARALGAVALRSSQPGGLLNRYGYGLLDLAALWELNAARLHAGIASPPPEPTTAGRHLRVVR